MNDLTSTKSKEIVELQVLLKKRINQNAEKLIILVNIQYLLFP